MTSKSHDKQPKTDHGKHDKRTRDKEFLQQEQAESVPSGVRPDLAKPGPDGQGGDAGGVGKSI
jgi:hypothetical protein